MTDTRWARLMCIYYKHGCREMKMKKEELEHHQKGCIFRRVSCPSIACNEKIFFKDITKHIHTSHKELDSLGSASFDEEFDENMFWKIGM